MKTVPLGPFKNISRLTLGGGGIGQGWGETSREEAMATIRLAINRGINPSISNFPFLLTA